MATTNDKFHNAFVDNGDGTFSLQTTGGGGGGGGDASAANQLTEIARLEQIRDRLPNPLAQPLTDAQLRAAAVPVSGPLTDAQLRATAVPVAPNITRGTGVVDSNTQRVTLATDGPMVTSVGGIADAAASSDTGSFSILAFIKRGLQNWTTLLARIAVLDNSKYPVIPSMTTGGNVSAQTNATGTSYTAFGSQALKQLTVSNQTGVTLEFQQGASGVGFQVPTGAFYTFFGITNANQIGVRRVDQSSTQVTVTARWEN